MFDITEKIKEFNVFNDKTVPRLISYPRTGSHWFRILMEAYLREPAAVQSFFHAPKDVTSIWGFHIHHRLIKEPHPSEGPVGGLKNVIYLYRKPIDTIFSQMKYHNVIPSQWNGKPNNNIISGMKKFKQEYYDHLDFYLNNKSNIPNLHYVQYEDLQSSPINTFEGCINFLGKQWNQQQFHEIYLKCDKQLTKKLTPHDAAAVNIDEITRQQIMSKQRDDFLNICGEEINYEFKDLV
jgi:hypothetical protein